MRYAVGIALTTLFILSLFAEPSPENTLKTMILFVANSIYFSLMISIDLLEQIIGKQSPQKNPAQNLASDGFGA